jgi:hypothetical protein
MSDPYSVVMDENQNPLKRLPKAQRFQIMLFLSVMWTTVFCVAIGSFAFWGELIVGHVALALGVFITGLTFKAATKQTHRDLYRDGDGTARYDDVWGG